MCHIYWLVYLCFLCYDTSNILLSIFICNVLCCVLCLLVLFYAVYVAYFNLVLFVIWYVVVQFRLDVFSYIVHASLLLWLYCVVCLCYFSWLMFIRYVHWLCLFSIVYCWFVFVVLHVVCFVAMVCVFSCVMFRFFIFHLSLFTVMCHSLLCIRILLLFSVHFIFLCGTFHSCFQFFSLYSCIAMIHVYVSFV